MKLKTRARMYAFCSSLWLALAFADASIGRYGWALFNLIIGWIFGLIAIDLFGKVKEEGS